MSRYVKHRSCDSACGTVTINQRAEVMLSYDFPSFRPKNSLQQYLHVSTSQQEYTSTPYTYGRCNRKSAVCNAIFYYYYYLLFYPVEEKVDLFVITLQTHDFTRAQKTSEIKVWPTKY